MKGDERILGDGDFVEKSLKTAQENLDRKYQMEADGYDFEWLAARVAMLLENLNQKGKPIMQWMSLNDTGHSAVSRRPSWGLPS